MVSFLGWLVILKIDQLIWLILNIDYSKNRIFKIISIEGMLIVVSGIIRDNFGNINFALLIQNITHLKDFTSSV